MQKMTSTMTSKKCWSGKKYQKIHSKLKGQNIFSDK